RAERHEHTARQEERETQAANAALEKAAILQQQGRWQEAQAVLESALRLLADSNATDLVERVSRARTDAEMVATLEEIRLRLSEGSRFQDSALPTAEKLYLEAFAKYGIPLSTLDPAEAAARIRSSAIRETLVAFMHDWLQRLSDEYRGRLRDVL